MDCCNTENKITLLDYARELHRLSSAILKDAETLHDMQGVICNHTVEANLQARMNANLQGIAGPMVIGLDMPDPHKMLEKVTFVFVDTSTPIQKS